MILKAFLVILFGLTIYAKDIFGNKLIEFSADDVLKEEWKTYKLQHDKEYADETEDNMRLRIFAENRMFIAEHNQRYERGEETYTVDMNEYGDWTEEEVEQYMFGDNSGNETDLWSEDEYPEDFFTPPPNINIPRKINWIKKGAVTSVKYQGKCGSCWSFSAAAALEGQHFLKTGYLVDLSEQNLIDCATRFGTNGCGGGLAYKAFRYVAKNGGIDSYRSYPYEAREGKCRYRARNSAATARGYRKVKPKDEFELLLAVAYIGPISVSITAKGKGFRFYKSGVYYNPKCSKTRLGHAVAVVGYGKTVSGKKYWLVKNSWGSKWGMHGYIKMARFRNNHCGIATRPCFPVV